MRGVFWAILIKACYGIRRGFSNYKGQKVLHRRRSHRATGVLACPLSRLQYSTEFVLGGVIRPESGALVTESACACTEDLRKQVYRTC